MDPDTGFDLTTEEVLDWEVEAILAALDAGRLPISDHAANEAALDGLLDDDVYDAISFFDRASKDLPGNPLGRAVGISFERDLGRATVLVKVGWRRTYYIVVTVIAK